MCFICLFYRLSSPICDLNDFLSLSTYRSISDSKLPNAHETLLRLIKAKCADWEKACMSPVITTHVQFFLRVVFLKLDEKYVDHDATRGKSGAVPGAHSKRHVLHAHHR